MKIRLYIEVMKDLLAAWTETLTGCLRNAFEPELCELGLSSPVEDKERRRFFDMGRCDECRRTQ